MSVLRTRHSALSAATTAPRGARPGWIVVAALALVLAGAWPTWAQPVGGLDSLISALEAVIEQGNPLTYELLLAPGADLDEAATFAIELIRPGATRAVVRERDRAPLETGAGDGGLRVLVEVFVESGSSARILTAFLDLVRVDRPGAGPDWRVARQRRVASLDGLYRLSLDPTRQFDVSGLSITDEDFSITMSDGSAFVAEAGGGPTALVLVGNGTLRFAPKPAAERGQIRVFAGRDVLESPLRAAFVRVNPSDLDNHVDQGRLRARAVNARDLERAREVFAEEVNSSFSLDLSDLSRDPWSLVPPYGDFLVEVHTRKQGTLTYARSAREAEDVSLFNRRQRRNISVYASERRLRERGPSYSEDELVDYDVIDFLVDVSFDPDRQWFDGRARLRLRARKFLPLMTLRLAEPLVPRAVVSSQHGRLLALRVKGQNSVIVSFPEPLQDGDLIDLVIVYSGRLEPQPTDREVIEVAAQQTQLLQAEQPLLVPEPRFTYSNRSYWYPQNTVTDYATATVSITVPPNYDCVASGDPSARNPVAVAPGGSGQPEQSRYEFVAGQPLRYLAFVVSRFTPSATATVRLPPDVGADSAPEAAARASTGVYYDSMDLFVTANPRQVGRARSLTEQVGDILSFYGGLVGDLPYPTLTLAVSDSDLPGGHSPAYFALLNQPLPASPYSWRNDPVAFDNFPAFFLAHELAHQFWGQAVGWENYHEQWISEGLSQYFALLYAEHTRGDAAVRSIVRQMNRSVLAFADQGPIALGYRLGHIKGDSRVFRAIVYNKSALVLHMLRRLLGDAAFFRGLRAFYHQSRFTKVGTDDVRRAFEQAAGRPLTVFFNRWFRDADVPSLAFRWQQDGSDVVLRFEQRGALIELPVTVTFAYRSGEAEDVVVRVADRVTEMRVSAKGRLRSVKANDDHAALADIRQ